MKTVLKSIFLLTLSFSCFSQNSRKENLNLVFYDNCSNQIIEPEFEILYVSDLNYDLITVYKEVDDWVLQYSTTLKTKNDTIRIPKILFAGGNELHSRRWTYLNCGKVCDGKETDYYLICKIKKLIELVEEMSNERDGLPLDEAPAAASASPDLDLPIEDLDLSERPRNCLKRAQVNSVGELLQKTEDDLLAITNFGQKSLDEVIVKLDERGLSLRGSRG